MVNTHRGFRFTIGQGMTVIAALAVAFAIMPMPLAIDVAFATTCLVAIAHNRSRSSTALTLLSEPVGCLFCFLGLLAVGGVIGGWLLRPGTIADVDPWFIFLISSMAGLFGAARLRRTKATTEARGPDRDGPEAELKRVEHLLRRAHEDGDEVVISKLTAYRTRLVIEMQEAATDTWPSP
jgi:hypothetical protein